MAIERGTYLVPTLSAVGCIVTHGEAGGIPSWIVNKALSEAQRSHTMLHAAVEAGMNIAAGTDARTPLNRHDCLVEEMVQMVQIGLTAERTLLSATREGAINAGLSEVTGTLERGKAGDLIVVDGDPLTDITALRRIVLVAKDGAIHRSSLEVSRDRTNDLTEVSR